MRSLSFTLMVGMVVASCADQAPSPPKPQALQEMLAPCFGKFDSIEHMLQIAGAGARNPDYADQSKALALACGIARQTLEKRDPTSPCNRVVEAVELIAWQLSGAFEGSKELPSSTTLGVQTAGLEREVMQCARAQGLPTPASAMSAEMEEEALEAEAAHADALKAAQEAGTAQAGARQ
ncbi:MAG: hypothetical protein Q8L66_07650 [Caulobacter sp.]|nr:hypothetical protein [Caulobacter sp.]